ncbi:LysM peptidoglycan-binding domain-containing protein [Fructilactobacillus carniphilus]|uniref:LysM peptidoglycan-binding domain-containing protein n=1 Tax=Fructilactobacillus carniphilus TaxID=2940297 RepID=A0ABY5BWG3_9LACO|nr:LysM peptidoglycan-binding domain-containing protein [Fructilactobacillus carniphilus]USS90687.1 LysM peptidoglycan-binding domain-containing protein [Fructilactobacillus carniphilus]
MKNFKTKLYPTAALAAALTLGAAPLVASADTTTQPAAQTQSAIQSVQQAPTVLAKSGANINTSMDENWGNEATVFYGTLKQDMKGPSGHIYPAGTRVATSTMGKATEPYGPYYLYLGVEQIVGKGVGGAVDSQYVTPAGTEFIPDIGRDGKLIINNVANQQDVTGTLIPVNSSTNPGGNTGSGNQGGNTTNPGQGTDNDGNTDQGNGGSTTNPGDHNNGGSTGTDTGNKGDQGNAGNVNPGNPTDNGGSTGTDTSNKGDQGTQTPGQSDNSSNSGKTDQGNQGGQITNPGTPDTGNQGNQSSQTPNQGNDDNAGKTDQGANGSGMTPTTPSDNGSKTKQEVQNQDQIGNGTGTQTQKQDATTTKTTPVTIKNGDTLSGLSQNHGVSVGQIVKSNPNISDPNHVKVGTQVVIPQAQNKATAQTSGKGNLPQTGQANNSILSLVGAALISVAGLLGLSKLRKENK